MSHSDAYLTGFDHGRSCASWIDVPTLGERVSPEIDWVGYGNVTAGNVLEVMELYAHAAEENARQFSPFELTAHEFNTNNDPDTAWEDYDEGVHAGILFELSSREDDILRMFED